MFTKLRIVLPVLFILASVLILSRKSLPEIDIYNEAAKDYFIEMLQKDSDLKLYKFAPKIRGLVKIFNHCKSQECTPEQLHNLRNIAQSLIPWTDIDFLSKPRKGRGLVVPAGRQFFYFAYQTFKVLKLHGFSLPIEVFTIGDEFEPWQRDVLLTEFDNIKILDVTEFFDNEKADIVGWAVKPFAALASSFEEIMLMDADAMFLSNPEILFQDPEYIKTGTLFFLDRTMLPNKDRTGFVTELMPRPMSEEVKNTRFWNKLSYHEMESGIVLLNTAIVLDGLLAVCSLNANPIREQVYKNIHGDKETFWLGFAMINKKYHFNPFRAAAVGNLRDGNVCGKILHFDHRGLPLWWNSGLKYRRSFGLYPEFEELHYWSIENWWRFECNMDTDVFKFDEQTDHLINVVYREIFDSSYRRFALLHEELQLD